ncbi:phosphoribosylaminoimidazole carboxylase [Zalerion maritima]|uniref:Phosphoribosylaminoimidazole carboxylase n=1 Tax=Zalerion maritima TaxID=339359 RepID=A0AAD5RQA7_9PEZI|nr:phosphoribosylaminoimidazole carboxylase [Zalerion maritima]
MAPFRPTLGVLGGGQLGRMLCEAAGPLGIPVIVLDAEGSPAKQANGHPSHVTGSFKDPEKIRDLARKSDYLTVEIEHVDADVLEEISTEGVEVVETREDGTQASWMKKVPVHPAPRTLKLIQDKFLQKEHLRDHGVPISEQHAVESGEGQEGMVKGLRRVGEKLGFPFMLKARNGSYDGRGNYVVKTAEDVEAAAKEMKELNLYAEKWVPFKMELSAMVIRLEDERGDNVSTVAYPCVETVHEESICVRTYMPPRDVGNQIQEKAKNIAKQVIETVWGRGVFAVEMFLLEDDTILVNEIAPRPHNSGHYTIEAVPQMSQYKAQLYAVFGLTHPGLSPNLIPRVSSAMMVNILGGKDAESHLPLLTLADASFEENMDVHVHMYGKESKPSRKIGHITLVSTSLDIEGLERKATEYVEMADLIAAERRDSGSKSMRPIAAGRTITPKSTTLIARSTTQKKQEKPVEEKKSAIFGQHIQKKAAPLVAVTMGSDSDLKVLAAGLKILDDFKVPYEENITSAHRTPDRMSNFARDAAGRGIKVIIAAAGGAAHLPGMVASHTPLPVIGIPVKATHLDGQDSLLSIVQMPRGVPCATVGINNSTNAALLAIRILGASMPEFSRKMHNYQLDMENAVEEKAGRLQRLGYKGYLEGMK